MQHKKCPILGEAGLRIMVFYSLFSSLSSSSSREHRQYPPHPLPSRRVWPSPSETSCPLVANTLAQANQTAPGTISAHVIHLSCTGTPLSKLPGLQPVGARPLTVSCSHELFSLEISAAVHLPASDRIKCAFKVSCAHAVQLSTSPAAIPPLNTRSNNIVPSCTYSVHII